MSETIESNYVRPAVHYINTMVDDKVNDGVQKFLDLHRHRESPTSEVELVINTSGGDSFAMCAIVSRIIELNKEGITKVNTTVQGRAYSAGFYIFIVGYKRTIKFLSTVMFHESRLTISRGTPLEEVESIHDGASTRQELLLKLTKIHTTIPKNLLTKTIRERGNLIIDMDTMNSYLKDVNWDKYPI